MLILTFYITIEQTESNEINSSIKTLVDDCYRDNTDNKSSDITSKIATTSRYCNDRRVSTLDGGIGNAITTYFSYDRTRNTRTSLYKCSYETNNLFTLNSATYGSEKLTYPVSMITADELVYAGSSYEKINFRVYTHGGYWYWTISQSVFNIDGTGSTILNNYSGFGNSSIMYTNGCRS